MSKNWSEKYWELMVNENFEEAIPLKIKNFPKAFFKHRDLSERTIENIQENYVWLAEISSLNDPFECSIQIDNDECLRQYYLSTKSQELFKTLTDHDLTKKDIKSLTTSKKPFEEYIRICKSKNIPFNMSNVQQLEKVQNGWDKIVSEMNQKLRICSFSLTKKSLLLWSHYADEHKGISIEYDFINTDSIRAFIQPIMYSDKVHKMGFYEKYSTMKMIGSSLIKSTDWRYEQEWRLTIFKQGENFPRKMTTTTPKAIYLGTRFNLNDENLKKKLFIVAKEKRVPLYQMVKHPNKFELIKNKNVVIN